MTLSHTHVEKIQIYHNNANFFVRNDHYDNLVEKTAKKLNFSGEKKNAD